MRKDVKLGLAVGGILFTAVLAYVLFFASADRARHDQLGGNLPAPVDPVGGGGAAVDPPPGTGSSSGNVIEAPRHDSVVIGGPATRPAETANAVLDIERIGGHAAPEPGTGTTDQAASTGTWDWGRALQQGANDELIARSVTPGAQTERPGADSGQGVGTGTQVDRPVDHTSGLASEYIVKPGDTLWSIAKTEYGNPNFFPHLIRANPHINPSRLKAGDRLTIPPKDRVVPASVANAPATPQVVDPTRQYRVQAGDNLNTICRRLYGRTDIVRKLYELNRAVIGPNPSALKPNMVLALPEPPSGTGSIAPASPLADSLQ